MAEYIEREEALAIIEEKQKELCPVGRYGRSYVYGSDREKYDAWEEIVDALENIPAADVAPVTRCKNCKHKGWVQEPCHGKSVDYCRVWDCTLRNLESTFCSYGEPKEGEHMDVVGRKVVKTRAPHVCFGCGRKFERGAMMERSCVFDGTPWTCYLCESCQKASAELGWQDEYGFGDLRERSLEIEREALHADDHD